MASFSFYFCRVERGKKPSVSAQYASEKCQNREKIAKALATIHPLGELVVQNNNFAEGYTKGYNQFLAHYQVNTSISDESIASFLSKR